MCTVLVFNMFLACSYLVPSLFHMCTMLVHVLYLNLQDAPLGVVILLGHLWMSLPCPHLPRSVFPDIEVLRTGKNGDH